MCPRKDSVKSNRAPPDGRISDFVQLDEAAVLPLGLATAACGLFQKDFLAMNAPSGSPKPRGKTLLIWDKSTSVGGNAIELAVAAGYDVVTTASPHNFEYVRRLSAREAFDYRSKTVIADIVGAISGNRFVAMATPPTSSNNVPAGQGRCLRLGPAIARMLLGTAALRLTARRKGVRTGMIWGSALIANQVGPMIFEAFLPAALAEARFVAAAHPMAIGAGLAQVPVALERQRPGGSAAKFVVTL
jgi:hypothetical protein